MRGLRQGQVIRRMRQLRGMKQSHLAELVGVDQATVSRWERGSSRLSDAHWAKVSRLLQARPDPAEDAALKRLVETSAVKVHLVCDETHRLLAASPARQAEWRADVSEFLGSSLIGYASEEILAAEARLDELGWYDGATSSLAVDIGSNRDPVLRIFPGTMLWERIMLSDGCSGRLVTTIA
jgi:transcriptional regulator with XRE-family HTH domain